MNIGKIFKNILKNHKEFVLRNLYESILKKFANAVAPGSRAGP